MRTCVTDCLKTEMVSVKKVSVDAASIMVIKYSMAGRLASLTSQQNNLLSGW